MSPWIVARAGLLRTGIRTLPMINCVLLGDRPIDAGYGTSRPRCGKGAYGKEHTSTPIVTARTCRVHAQCAAGGVRVSWTMVHHRISHNATLPSEDHTSTPWTGSVAIGPRSPRMILPRADLLHTVIRTPLPYAHVPAYVTFRASASSFGPPFPHRARGAGHPALRAGCKTREHSDYR